MGGYFSSLLELILEVLPLGSPRIWLSNESVIEPQKRAEDESSQPLRYGSFVHVSLQAVGFMAKILSQSMALSSYPKAANSTL